MSLMAPAWLLVSAFGLLVLILHVRRRRTLQIPSIELWRQLQSGRMSYSRVRRPPINLLVLLQVLVVALCALALAQPLIGFGPRFTHEIIVVDASGSMRSTDVAPSRFDAAVAELARLAGPLKETGARTSTILASARPRLVAARLSDPDGLAPRFERLRAGDGDADWAQVARLAASVLKDGESTRLTLITDGADGGAARLAAALPDVVIETRTIAGAGGRNAALRAELHALDAGAGTWRAEGTVAFSPGFAGPTTVTALVQPRGSSGFLEWGSVEVRADPARAAAPGSPREATFVLDLEMPLGGAVVLRLPHDTGPQDDTAQFVVRPKPRVLKILQLGGVNDPLTRALRAAAEVELFAADSPPADTSMFDLVVVNGIELARPPETNVLWLGAARRSTEPGGQIVPMVSPGGWLADHPLMDKVSAGSIQPGQAYRFAPRRGAASLLESGGLPLLEARTIAAGRDIRIAFDIGGSGWTEQTSFPIFVSNLLRWIAPDLGRTIDSPCVVGTSCALDPHLIGADVGLVTVSTDRAPADTGAARVPTAAGSAVDDGFVPDRSGLYRLERNGLTRLVAVNRPAARERPVVASSDATASRMTDRGPVRSWLLGAMILLFAVEGWLAGRGTERFLRASALARGNPLAGRRRILLAARVATLLLVAAALIGLPIPAPDRGENLVVVAGPHLLGERGVAPLIARIDEAAEHDRIAGGTSRLGLVTVDAVSRVVADLGDDAKGKLLATAATNPQGANLEDALALAAAMLPAGAPGRIVVVSDGNETRGDAVRALPAMLERGVRIDVIPTNSLTTGEVLIEQVSAPERVYAGDTFRLQAVVYSHGPSPATVRILKDGETIVERSLELPAGRSRIDTDIPNAIAGRARYEVVVDAPGDAFPQNNRNGVLIDVAPAPDVLIVAAQPAWADVLAKALALQEIKSKVVEPRRAPFYLKDWLAYAGIVLMNVPAIDLTTQQQELIEKAVADHGRGLLLLGGENSFGPGGYYETPLERVSPLSSRVPRDAPKVALAFVLDRSGSMQRDEGGATRLDIAKQATLSAIRLLHEDSLISIVVFDSEAKVLLPLRRAKDATAVTQALAGLEPGGGTAIHPGLVEALRQLEGVDAMAKHIVVMSDGLSQPGDFPGILKAISEQGISVSTVAIGEGADGTRLEEIARVGKGAFHATQDFKALPSILSQEALLLSGKPVEEREALPVWSDRSAEFFAGLPGAMPPIHGYVLTTRKSEADLHLVVSDAKQEPVPLLASWRYGNGRVVALTTQGAGAWSRDWQPMREYPLLWAQMLRHVMPAMHADGLGARMVRHGDDVTVLVDAANPDGTARAGLRVSALLAGGDSESMEIALTETSAGHHIGHTSLQGTGDFVLRAAADRAKAETPLHVAYPAIYAFSRANPDRLVALAAMTGGRVLADTEPIFAGGERRWVAARDSWKIWVLAALALFLADLIIRYASGLRARGRNAREQA
jgi:Mg-chelatase subunit ChlD